MTIVREEDVNPMVAEKVRKFCEETMSAWVAEGISVETAFSVSITLLLAVLRQIKEVGGSRGIEHQEEAGYDAVEAIQALLDEETFGEGPSEGCLLN